MLLFFIIVIYIYIFLDAHVKQFILKLKTVRGL